MSRFRLQIVIGVGMVLLTFLLHVFLFSDSGYFTRQKLQDRLHAIRGQIEELENENLQLQQRYSSLEEEARTPQDESGATILTFETREVAESQFSTKMERTLADPEMIFFIIMSLVSTSLLILTRMLRSDRNSAGVR